MEELESTIGFEGHSPRLFYILHTDSIFKTMSRFDRNALLRMLWDMNASRRSYSNFSNVKRKALQVFPSIWDPSLQM